MLVVMEDGNLHLLAKRRLDDEALRRLDVLEVDPPERGLEGEDDVDELLRILLGDLDVEHVDVGELLEEDPLALHDRLARQRSDVAQPKHRRTVRHHGHQVALRRVLVRRVRPLLDLEARLGHSG